MNFKEWFNTLNEGVTVMVDIPPEQHGKEPPEDILSLTYKIIDNVSNFAATLPRKHPELEKYLYINNLQPDGMDYNKKEGIVNFYTDHRWGPNENKKILDKIKSEIENQGVTVGNITSNTFADKFKSPKELKQLKQDGIKPDDIRVYRIPVKIDPKASEDNQPKVHMGFRPAEKLFVDIFGLPSAGPDPTIGAVKQLKRAFNPQDQHDDEDDDKPTDWNGYQFTADHIIKVFERLVTPPNAKAYIKTLGEKTREIPYNEFLKEYYGTYSTAEFESNGDFRWSGITLPKGNYQVFMPMPGVQVAATTPRDDLEREARTISVPPTSGPGFIDMGTPAKTIMERARNVYKLALWAKKHGYNEMGAF